MEVPKEVQELLGKSVSYCRTKPTESGGSELFIGKGTITGIIIGASKRIQFLVQDLTEGKDKAWTIDPICINPKPSDADSYFAHHLNLKNIVDEHNKSQKEREQQKIKEVDDLNHSFFGQPLVF